MNVLRYKLRLDCKEMSWVELLIFYTFPARTPTRVLCRILQELTYHKNNSDYLLKPIPKKGLEYIFKRMTDDAIFRPPLPLDPSASKI